VGAHHRHAREAEQHPGQAPAGQPLAQKQVGADRDQHRLRVDDGGGGAGADRLEPDELEADEAGHVRQPEPGRDPPPAPAQGAQRGRERECAEPRARRRDPQRRRLAQCGPLRDEGERPDQAEQGSERRRAGSLTLVQELVAPAVTVDERRSARVLNQ
jgi:hypothetical protein